VKNIILSTIFVSTFIYADTVGIDMESWVEPNVENSITPIQQPQEQVTQQFPTQSDTTFADYQKNQEVQEDEVYVVPPAQENIDDIPMATIVQPQSQSQSTIEPSVIKEIISESRDEQVVIKEVPQVKVINQEVSKKETPLSVVKDLSSFFAPIATFAKDNLAQFFTLAGAIGTFLYLFLFGPLLRSAKKQQYSEDIDVSSHIVKKEQKKDEVKEIVSEENILTQTQFSTLKGLLNESFIYAKEEVLLSGNLLQEDKNRELVMLDWKYNQILNFSLPKLDTTSSKTFTQGAKELLDEKESRDIIKVALEDILKEGRVTDEDRNFLQTILNSRKELQTNATLKYKDGNNHDTSYFVS